MMFKFSRSTPPSAEFQLNRKTQDFWASELLASDTQFAALLAQMDPADRQQLFSRSRHGARFTAELTWRAVALDRPQALAALRTMITQVHGSGRPSSRSLPAPGIPTAQAALRAGSWRIAAAHVTSGHLAAEAFVARFGTQHQAELRALVPCRDVPCKTYLALYPEAHADALPWVHAKQLPYHKFVKLAHVNTEAALQHAMTGVAEPGVILYAMRYDTRAGELAGELVRRTGLTARAALDTLAGTNGLRDAAFAWVLEDLISPHDYFSYVRFPRPEHLKELADAQKISLTEWMTYGMPPSDVLYAAICAGQMDLSASLIETGALDAQHVHLLQQKKVRGITPEMIGKALGEKYTPARALAAEEVTFAASFATLPDLLKNLTWPLNPAHRLSYAARMGAAMLQGSHAYQTVQADETASMCVVCDEPTCHTVTKPAACAHPATFGLDCLQKAVEASVNDTCPYPECVQALTPNDIIAFEMGGDKADQLARRIVNRALTQVPGWRYCATEQCIGGMVTTWNHAAATPSCCPVCAAPAVFKNSLQADMRVDKRQIRRLIKDLHFMGTMKGKIRECYNCGVPTEHMGGCSHMACSHCGAGFDFVTGQHGARRSRWHQNQAYVPKDGLMVRAGMYNGLTPGTRHRSLKLRSVVFLNALRSGIYLGNPFTRP